LHDSERDHSETFALVDVVRTEEKARSLGTALRFGPANSVVGAVFACSVETTEISPCFGLCSSDAVSAKCNKWPLVQKKSCDIYILIESQCFVDADRSHSSPVGKGAVVTAIWYPANSRDGFVYMWAMTTIHHQIPSGAEGPMRRSNRIHPPANNVDAHSSAWNR
jgi:hypothetical protein